jgi:hypothetical protein
MLTIKPVEMSLVGQTWQGVMDETGACLGTFCSAEAAGRYKARLEKSGINCAEDLIALGKDPAHRASMRTLMAPGAL